MRSAVVELGQPWQSASVQRKLPPLKYYYDLEMGELEGTGHEIPHKCMLPREQDSNHQLMLSQTFWMFRTCFYGNVYWVYFSDLLHTTELCWCGCLVFSRIYTHADSSTFVWSHGPCLEPALAQTSIAFGRSHVKLSTTESLVCLAQVSWATQQLTPVVRWLTGTGYVCRPQQSLHIACRLQWLCV